MTPCHQPLHTETKQPPTYQTKSTNLWWSWGEFSWRRESEETPPGGHCSAAACPLPSLHRKKKYMLWTECKLDRLINGSLVCKPADRLVNQLGGFDKLRQISLVKKTRPDSLYTGQTVYWTNDLQAGWTVYKQVEELTSRFNRLQAG